MLNLEIMSRLSTLYTQPHRTYHNMNHINECLVEFENLPVGLLSYQQIGNHKINEKQVVEMAIWYHDAVYNPYSKLNEANSAALLPVAHPHSRAHMDSVRDTILATSKHIFTQPDLSLATQVMLDIDLAGFGKSTRECVENGENVRKEYYKTNDYDFYTGRLNFLKTIGLRESLYYTDYFKEKYHDQSQKNLKFETEIAIEIIDDWSGM